MHCNSVRYNMCTMTLNDYLKDRHGSLTELARALGLQPAQVWQWKAGLRSVPMRYCAAIEAATAGQVTRVDLRPDDAHLIWPDLPAPQGQAAEQGVAHG